MRLLKRPSLTTICDIQICNIKTIKFSKRQHDYVIFFIHSRKIVKYIDDKLCLLFKCS